MPAKHSKPQPKKAKRKNKKPQTQQSKPNQNQVARSRKKTNHIDASVGGYLATGFRDSGLSFAALSVIAQALCAPRDILPMRLPEVIRRRTDVKHLWVATDFVANTALTHTDYAATVGTTRLSLYEGICFMLRNPVAPLIYSTPYLPGSSTLTGFYNWALSGRDANVLPSGYVGTGGAYNFMWFDPPGLVKASPAAPAVITPSADIAYLAPYTAYYDSSSTAEAPGGVTQEPGYITRSGKYYGFYGGGRLVLDAVHCLAADVTGAGAPVAVPVGGGVIIHYRLCRYNGTADDDEVAQGTFTISNPSASVSAFIEGGIPFGYYRFFIARIVYNAPTADFTYGAIRMNVRKVMSVTTSGSSAAWNMSYVLVNPVNTAIVQAPYTMDCVRVNAMGSLLTNVTPNLARGGDIFGVRVAAGEDWTTFGPQAVMSRAGGTRTSYRGNLEKGAYTWSELPDDYVIMKDYQGKPGNSSSSSRFFFQIYLDDPAPVHILSWIAPDISGSIIGTTSMLQARCDYHIEYISSSQLATNAISSLDTADLTKATIALANAPLFTENWAHLNQLWGAIKSAGKSILHAGGKAAAAVALREMAAGVAALAL